jgi:hypothetical protein
MPLLREEPSAHQRRQFAAMNVQHHRSPTIEHDTRTGHPSGAPGGSRTSARPRRVPITRASRHLAHQWAHRREPSERSSPRTHLSQHRVSRSGGGEHLRGLRARSSTEANADRATDPYPYPTRRLIELLDHGLGNRESEQVEPPSLHGISFVWVVMAALSQQHTAGNRRDVAVLLGASLAEKGRRLPKVMRTRGARPCGGRSVGARRNCKRIANAPRVTSRQEASRDDMETVLNLHLRAPFDTRRQQPTGTWEAHDPELTGSNSVPATT